MPSSEPLGHWGTLAVSLSATVIGLAVVIVAGRPLVRGFASLRWPVARGTVQHAEVKPRGKLLAVYIAYTYEVDGRTFTGTRYRFGQIGDVASVVSGTPTNWHPGQAITVHYNPSDPATATVEAGLQPRASIGEFFLVIFGASFFWTGITYLLPMLGRFLGR
jgi:hypothetical protein